MMNNTSHKRLTDNLADQVKSLKAEAAALQSKVQAAEQRSSQLTADLKEATRAKEDVVQQLSTARSEISALQEGSRQLERFIGTQKAEKDRLQAEKHGVQERLDDLRVAQGKLLAEHGKLQQELASALAERDGSMRLSSASEQFLSQECKRLKDEGKSLSEKNLQNAAEKGAQSAEMEKLRRELCSALVEAARCSERTDRMVAQAAQLQQEKVKLTERLHDSETALTAKLGETAEAAAGTARAQEQLAISQASARDLEER
eukprot:6391878-Prymnesium_polylepis.1